MLAEKSEVYNLTGQSFAEALFAQKPKVDKFEELVQTILNSSKFVANDERKNIIAQLVSNKFDVDAINFTRFRNRLKDGLWLLWRKGWEYGEEDVRNAYFSDSDESVVAEFNDVLDGLKNLITGLKNQITNNKQEIKALESSILADSKSLASSQKQLETLLRKTGNDEKINIIDDNIQTLEANLEAFRKQIKAKQDENITLNEQVKLFTEQFKTQKKQIEETAKTAKIQELQTSLVSLQQKQQDPKNKFNLGLTKQIKEKSEELSKLQREKATTKRAVKMSEHVVEIAEEVSGEKGKTLKKLTDEQLEKRISDKIAKRQKLSLKKVKKLQGEVLETPVDLRQKRLDITSAKIAEAEEQVKVLGSTDGRGVNTSGKPNFNYKEIKNKVKNKIPLTIEERTFYDVEKEFRTSLTAYNSTQDDSGKITKLATAFERYEQLKQKNPESLTESDQELIEIIEDYRDAKKTVSGTTTTGDLTIAQKRLDHLKRKKSLLEKEKLPENFYKEVVKTRQEQTRQTSKNVEAGINYYIDQSDFGRVYLERRLEYIAKSYEEQEKKHILKRMAQVFQLGTGEDEVVIDVDGKVKNKTLQTKIQEYFEQNRLTYFPNTGEMRGFGNDYNVLGAEGLVAGKRKVFDLEGNLSDKRAIPASNKFRSGVGNYYKDLGTIGKTQRNFISREAQLIDYYRNLIYGDAPKTAQELLRNARESKLRDKDIITLTPEEQKGLGFTNKNTITVQTLKRYVGERKTMREYVDKKTFFKKYKNLDNSNVKNLLDKYNNTNDEKVRKSVLESLQNNYNVQNKDLNGFLKKYNMIDGVDIKQDVLNGLLKKYNITDQNKKITLTSAEARSLGVTNRNLSYNALKRHVDGLQMDYFSGKAARIVRTELAAANHLGRLNYIVENDDIGLVRWVVDKEHIFRRAVCERINNKDMIFKNSVITHGMGCFGRSIGQSIGVGKRLSGVYRTVDMLTQPTLMVPLHPYCMCEVRPLRDDELDGVLMGVEGVPTSVQLAGIGAGSVTIKTLAEKDKIAEKENQANPFGTFLTASAAVILTTVAMTTAYKLAFSNKQVATKIIKELDDTLPRKSTDIVEPKLPIATRKDLQQATKESLVIGEMLKDLQTPEQTPLKIPLNILENNRELVELELSNFKHVRESVDALNYGIEHYDELSDEVKRSLLNIRLPERLNVALELEDYLKPETSFLEQALEEAKNRQGTLRKSIEQKVVLLPPKNNEEIKIIEDKIKKFIDEKNHDYKYYDKWLKRINTVHDKLYADLPTRKDIKTYTKQEQKKLATRLKALEEQIEMFDSSFFEKLDIDTFDLTAYLETLEADGADFTPNMRKFIENRGSLQWNIISDDLITMAEKAKYTTKISLPNYKSLFKPDGKRKVSNLTVDNLEKKEDVLRELENLINDPNKKLNKPQIKYLAQKYNIRNLDNFLDSNRLKPTVEEKKAIDNLMKKELRHIRNAEFNCFQQKWAMFGSPK